MIKYFIIFCEVTLICIFLIQGIILEKINVKSLNEEIAVETILEKKDNNYEILNKVFSLENQFFIENIEKNEILWRAELVSISNIKDIKEKIYYLNDLGFKINDYFGDYKDNILNLRLKVQLKE
ncbi:hypothetical protein [Clostridium fallax]|uniref:Uncharacterized protein n=1 Tax=Clostridium fallax TaxID=1533 RepID=A0A1M4ZLK8_9CLOT|nr:hypothetical protein [Clostridium fallax]SHF18692.1 hypothetical protein SAMN05443638_1564 [Clostridium fallax]SQB06330.1 Uncharacterised protein [Clostridium fallax]